MILDGIDVFVGVVRAGSFTGAARVLAMPAATVSAKLARLEERLGVTLIQRSTRRMHVTEAGRSYFAHCVEALSMLEAGEEQLMKTAGGPSGLLRITASSEGAQQVLPALVASFLAAYPKMSVELIVTNTQLDLLAAGIDLALRPDPMPDSSLQSRKYGPARFALFASDAYLAKHGTPQAPDDLETHFVMAHSRLPADKLTMVSSAGRFLLKPQSRVRADDMQTLRAIAVQGGGIALLPDLSPATDLTRVLPGYSLQSGNLYFVYPARKYTPVNVKAFVDLAVAAPG